MERGSYVIKRVLPLSVASLLGLYSASIELFTYSRFESGVSLFILAFLLFFLKFVVIQIELTRVDRLNESTSWTFYLINHIFLPVSSYLLLFLLSSLLEDLFTAVLFGILFLLTMFYDDILVATYQQSSDFLHRAHFVFDFYKIFNIYLFGLLFAIFSLENPDFQILFASIFTLIVFFTIKLTLYKSEKISKLNLLLTCVASLLVSSIFLGLTEFKSTQINGIALSITATFIVTTLFLTKVASKEMHAASFFKYLLAYSAIGLLVLSI